ncbi:MAG: carbohydrate ABC transporter permease [Pseudonocardiales bacterium]|nr:carbohydrate ABC transporter permease [Pseudonocardiales bacterium]
MRSPSGGREHDTLPRPRCAVLPTEPEEAALIEGWKRWQAFRQVVLPPMRSGIAALSAIIVRSAWGEFLIPLRLTSTSASKPVRVSDHLNRAHARLQPTEHTVLGGRADHLHQ